MNDAAPFQLPAALEAPLLDSPLVIVDVGARGGLQPRWQILADHLTWIGFEPDSRSAAGIDASAPPARRHVLHTAVAETRGPVTFHRTRDAGDSSLLRPNMDFLKQFGRPERFDVVDTVELPADTLDAQLREIDLPHVDFLKLDTQGTELAILKGAELTLGGVLGVDIEVEFSPLYEQQPLFGDVDAFLRRHDLQLFDLGPRRWPYQAGHDLAMARGPVIWAEAIYLRTVDAVRRGVAAAGATRRVAHLAKAVTVALIYGYPDFALALIDGCAALVDGSTGAGLTAAVRQWDASAPEPSMPITIEVSPAQLREMRAIQARAGTKPTAQVRKALRAWLLGQSTG